MIARVLSCRDRRAQLEKTIADLAISDWKDDPIVHLDGDGAGTRLDRINANWQAAIRGTVNSGIPSLILEDDVRVNRHLRHNLQRWSPAADPLFFGSIYNGAGIDVRAVDAQRMWGGQGIVVSAAMAAHLIEHWDDEPGFADTRMPRVAVRRAPVYQHAPSLVQHIGRVSTWGGPFHQAADFDADWRAL